MNELAVFDYSELDSETRLVIQQEDKEFDRNMQDANSSFIHGCKNLQRINTALSYKRPGFEAYCQSKAIPVHTAYRMIRVAEMSDKLSEIPAQQFGKSALYLLASPSTSDDARQEAINRARNGEMISHATAREIVLERRPEPPPAHVQQAADNVTGRMPRIMQVEATAPAAPAVLEWASIATIAEWVAEWAKRVKATHTDLEMMLEVPYHVGWNDLRPYLDQKATDKRLRIHPQELKNAVREVHRQLLEATKAAKPISSLPLTPPYAIPPCPVDGSELVNEGCTVDELNRSRLDARCPRCGGLWAMFANPAAPQYHSARVLRRPDYPFDNVLVDVAPNQANDLSLAIQAGPKRGDTIRHPFTHDGRAFAIVAATYTPDGLSQYEGWQMIPESEFAGHDADPYHGFPVLSAGKKWLLSGPRHLFQYQAPPDPLDVLQDALEAMTEPERVKLADWLMGTAAVRASIIGPTAAALMQAFLDWLIAPEMKA